MKTKRFFVLPMVVAVLLVSGCDDNKQPIGKLDCTHPTNKAEQQLCADQKSTATVPVGTPHPKNWLNLLDQKKPEGASK